jgi:hypothetical protein
MLTGATGDFAITLVQGPTEATLQQAQGQLDAAEGAATVDAVCNIPLQAPEAVSNEVLRMLGLSPSSSSPTAAAAETETKSKPGFLYYGKQRSFEELTASASPAPAATQATSQ